MIESLALFLIFLGILMWSWRNLHDRPTPDPELDRAWAEIVDHFPETAQPYRPRWHDTGGSP